jgi:hypothetical protein
MQKNGKARRRVKFENVRRADSPKLLGGTQTLTHSHGVLIKIE